jgi:hypothetical protein
MLNQWLRVMVCNAETVVVNYYVLTIAHHSSQPLVQYITPSIITFGTAWQSMIHNNWLRITHNDSQPMASMVCNSEAVVFNHGLLYCAKDCELLCVILSQWLSIMVCYAEPVVVNHGVLCWAVGCESEWIVTMIHNHWLSITHHDSQPLVQHSTPWLVILSQWLWIILWYIKPLVVDHGVLCWSIGSEYMLLYSEQVVVNHSVLCWAIGCESWWDMLTHWLRIICVMLTQHGSLPLTPH